MPFDQAAYRKTVLEPAKRAGNAPPADLLVRYGLTNSDLKSDNAFNARVAEVSNYWRNLNAGNNKLFKKLLQALLAAHAELERRGELTPKAFRERQDAAVAAARARLGRKVSTIAESVTCIPLTTLERLVEDGDGLLGEREVREALRKQGVSVIDPPWEIPAGPPLPAARALPDHVRVLGLRLSIELVLGAEGMRAGFSVKGGFRNKANETIGPSTLEQARKNMATRPHDERKTASDNVIALLTKALETRGKLEQLLIWEIAGILRPDIAAGLPVRAVAQTAIEIGLDPGEALELAVTLTTATAPAESSTADGSAQVEELLRTNDLRQAKELAESLPAEEVSAAVRARLAAALQEVATILAEADKALADGDREQEALLLAKALGKMADPDVQRRLERIPPPPPTSLKVMADGDRIALSWRHSQARTGTVRYRVVRSTTAAPTVADAGEHLAETETDSAVDPQPPIGVPTHYCVFATRSAAAWSAGAGAEPIVILPEVRDLELDANATRVTGAWRTVSGTVDVEVLRTAAGDGGPGERIALREGNLDGFVDETVRTGVRYEYRVRAVYRTASGQRLATVGVVATARPEGEPVGILDLAAELVADTHQPVLRASWTQPAAGTAEIRLASAAPEWQPGTVLPLATAQSYGRAAAAPVSQGANARAVMDVPVRDGTTFFTAMTMGVRKAVVGNTVQFAVVNPVTDLRATRRGPAVRLSWIWPEGARLVLIRWSGEGTHGERLLTRREFDDDGGFTVESGHGAVDISVMTAVQNGASLALSAPSTRAVTGKSALVRWRFRRRGILAKRVTLILTSDIPCEVPELTIVRGQDGRRPQESALGEQVAQIPRSRLSPEAAVEHAIGRERQTGPVGALALFPKERTGAGLILLPATQGAAEHTTAKGDRR